MIVDEEKIYKLIKYASKKGDKKKKVESDHNTLLSSFKLTVQGKRKNQRIETFNF